eukprot:s1536_g22.t6
MTDPSLELAPLATMRAHRFSPPNVRFLIVQHLIGDVAFPSASALQLRADCILANLLHRRPATSKTLGEQGIAELLVKLHRWCSQGIDFSIPAAERGHRMLHFGASAPAPSGVGEPLLAPPPWLTPTIVCVQQLLCQADLVKMRESREALDKETQQMWVSLILDLLYAFPGLDGTLAQPCLQVLLRLCSVSVGAKAFLAYQRNPRSIAQCMAGSPIDLVAVASYVACVSLCAPLFLESHGA